MTLRIGEPEFPVGGDSGNLADWAELYVISGAGPLRRASLSRVAERENGGGTKVVSDTAWLTLSDRSVLHGDRWPLQFDAELVAREHVRPDMRALYTFLCALSLSDDVGHADRRLFEHCVADLIIALTRGPSLRIGSPRTTPIPTRFDHAVLHYSAQSNETAVQLSDPDATKDLGLDVASWLPFGDERGSYLHVVGQCATGGNWREKTTDLNLNRWRDHMQWGVYPPITFLAIPRVILTREELRRISLEAGLVLDRPRLLELCARRSLTDERRDEIEAACADLLPWA